jgi:hypothetical protein
MCVNIALWLGSSQKPLIPSCDATSGKHVLTEASNDTEFGCNPVLHSPAFVMYWCLGSSCLCCNTCQKLSSVSRMFYVEHLLFGVNRYYYKLKISTNVISLCNPWLYLRMHLVRFTSHPYFVMSHQTYTCPVQNPNVVSYITCH